VDNPTTGAKHNLHGYYANFELYAEGGVGFYLAPGLLLLASSR